MVAVDEDALICDLAETYHIYDWRSHPFLCARLAAGLRDDSRIKMKLSGAILSPRLALQASILDDLNIMIWQNTQNGVKGKNRPESILQKLGSKKTNDERQVKGFSSAAEFEEARKRILQRKEHRWLQEQN